jgi:hypothetical protein
VYEMSGPVAAILHWDADADTALERYERAVTTWREKFSGQSAGPLHAIAGRSERGGLVVVNVFPTNEDHLAFGRNMGDPLAAVGLPTPDVEHVSVRRLGWPEIADGNNVDSSAGRSERAPRSADARDASSISPS